MRTGSHRALSPPHSACHSALKNWQGAYEDALVSISKDPKFIKGYYRLASAQTELMKFDEAETTLRAALTMEPGSYHFRISFFP
jgi:tetratricopeptide (TPR) repeat protein